MRTTRLIASLLFITCPTLANAGETNLGIGVSWNAGLADSGLSPDSGSLRIRLPAGTVIEPRLSFWRGVQGVGTGIPDAHSEAASLALRTPVARRRSVELQLLGAVSLQHSRFEDQRAFAASLSWGLGLEWFATRQLSLGADATSRVASLWEMSHSGGADRAYDLGPFFDPWVRVNAALYF